MFGMPNPDPDGANWTVLFGSFLADEEDADSEEETNYIGIVAVTDADDLPGVTEREYRFELFEDSEENPHAVYFGVCLHRHEDDDHGAGCETFHAEDDETDLDDVPDNLVEAFEEVMEMEVYPPGGEPVDAEPVAEADLLEPDTDPGGMFH